MTRVSAGLLMYRFKDEKLEVFLIHPGGPFYINKDAGFWFIPKGEIDEKDRDDLFETAKREFREETGLEPNGHFTPLGFVKQKAGKIVHAWAFEGDWNGLLMTSSYFDMEWPPKSGKFKKFPEVDKAAFFTVEKAKQKINTAQFEFIERLQKHLKIKT